MIDSNTLDLLYSHGRVVCSVKTIMSPFLITDNQGSSRRLTDYVGLLGNSGCELHVRDDACTKTRKITRGYHLFDVDVGIGIDAVPETLSPTSSL